MMEEHDALAVLVREIYDTTLCPEIWSEVLSRVGLFADSQGGGLLTRDLQDRSAEAFYTFGVAPHYVESYFEQYAKFDPTIIALASLEVGKVVSTNDILPLDEFFDTRFYKEWARPQRWIDAMQIVLDRSGKSLAQLSLMRNEAAGLADEKSKRRLQLLVPHLRRAVLISNVIDRRRDDVATFADTLDGVSAGMFLLDEQGAIVHANASGHAMLGMGDVVHSVSGRLAASDRQSQQVLQGIVAAAAQGDAAVGVAGIAQPLAGLRGDPHVAHIMPLTSGERHKAGRHYAAKAVLFVHRAALQLQSAPDSVGRFYKLTPSELRVLFAIVQVGGTPEAAEALGISETTVRTHLQRVFAKTGTGRQADLVKIVAEFSSPLAAG